MVTRIGRYGTGDKCTAVEKAKLGWYYTEGCRNARETPGYLYSCQQGERTNQRSNVLARHTRLQIGPKGTRHDGGGSDGQAKSHSRDGDGGASQWRDVVAEAGSEASRRAQQASITRRRMQAAGRSDSRASDSALRRLPASLSPVRGSRDEYICKQPDVRQAV